jgi:hypothetical protein
LGLILKEIEVDLCGKNINHYKNLGYNLPYKKGKWGITIPHGSTLIVKIEDLMDGSKVKVDVECDGCGKELNIYWQDYRNHSKEDGKYFCVKCAINLYGMKSTSKTKLQNGKSFEQWCKEHEREDILARWDFELNDCSPSEISYATNKKYYFKCPKGIHKSELKNIYSFISGNEGSIDCKACNSFAQWGINNLGNDFLEKYWDYEKNTVDPWVIASQYNKKVYIKCQQKDYHGSYDVKPNSFVGSNARCPFCNKNSGKVHPKDSLGQLLEDRNLLYLWSDKNKKSPYEYTPMSSRHEVYWKCPDKKHEDYPRLISSSNFCNFRCPDCNFSFGEDRINQCLIDNNWIRISQKDYDILVNKNDNNYYIPQKTFNGLTGIGGKLLSYDFYFPQYKILCEYQGQFHDGSGNDYMKLNLKTQQEHDRRKREYAQKHNIKLLEIWYWDFDNIETILNEYLHINNTK